MYVLAITSYSSSSRAVTPKAGDTYLLTIYLPDGIKTSSGTVQSVTGGEFTLASSDPSSDSTSTFTVSITAETLTEIKGTIPCDDGNTVPAPAGALTKSKQDVLNLNELDSFLSGKPDNTPNRPYIVKIKLKNEENFWYYGGISSMLKKYPNKYVHLDLSECTNLTSIDSWVFMGCPTLAGITLPNTVKSIGEATFVDTSLTGITLPVGVTSIGPYAFQGSALKSISISKNITSIGDGAFQECKSLTHIVIPDSLTGMLPAFWQCSSLRSIIIGNGITSLREWSFPGCTSLTTVVIGNGIKTIAEGAFNGCTSLARITIPKNVTSTGPWSFAGCTSLTSIIIEGLRTIGDGTFAGCTSLTNITIPKSVTSIETNAFYECDNLISVTFQGTIPSDNFGSWVTTNYGNEFWGIGLDGLYEAFYTTDPDNGTPGTYTRAPNGDTWTKS
jgi:hypothetical protein